MTNRRSTDEPPDLNQCGHEPGAVSQHSILVPLDGSPAAAQIVPMVQTIARRLRGPMQLIHVAQDPLSRVMHQRVSGFPIAAVPMVDSPAETIAREARVHKCRLIALSALSESTGGERLLGHVTLDVLRRAPCSVLAVQPHVAAHYLSEHPTLSRILIPLDGAPSTAAVLARQELRGWIRTLRSRHARAGTVQASPAALDVIHVVGETTSSAGEPGTLQVPRYMDHPYYEWQGWAKEFLARFCENIDFQPVHVAVVVGDPGHEIARAARERQSDLIMLIWKGQFDEGRAAAVQTVLREAPCPILLIRQRMRPAKEAAGVNALP